MKKGSYRFGIALLSVAFLIVMGTAVMLLYDERDPLTANVVIDSNNAIRVPDSDQELPNEEEGTISLWTKPPVEIFGQFTDARKYIIFLSATNIPGVRVVYNMEMARFEAGSPLISTPAVDIFDQREHQVVYAYKKGEKQVLYLDGVLVNESNYKPLEIVGASGFAVYDAIPAWQLQGAGLEVFDRFDLVSALS